MRRPSQTIINHLQTTVSIDVQAILARGREIQAMQKAGTLPPLKPRSAAAGATKGQSVSERAKHGASAAAQLLRRTVSGGLSASAPKPPEAQ